MKIVKYLVAITLFAIAISRVARSLQPKTEGMNLDSRTGMEDQIALPNQTLLLNPYKQHYYCENGQAVVEFTLTEDRQAAGTLTVISDGDSLVRAFEGRAMFLYKRYMALDGQFSDLVPKGILTNCKGTIELGQQSFDTRDDVEFVPVDGGRELRIIERSE